MKTIPSIDENLCTGCGRCVKACPQDVLELAKIPGQENTKKALAVIAKPDACTECGSCVAVCKQGALSLNESDPARSGVSRDEKAPPFWSSLMAHRQGRGGRRRGGRGGGNRRGRGPKGGR